MSNEQKLRDALQAIANIDDATNHSVDASAALDHIGQIARQALALSTADHLPDDFGYFDGHTDTAWMAWQARAALSAGDAGWQPIETAPKDGSDCWLLVDGDVRRGFWVEIEFEERRDMDGRYIDQTDADAYWMDHDSGDSLEPTMFYPITKPLPPSLVDIDAAMRKDKP